MKNIFKVSEQEKNRIRLLHEAESKNKKISSVLNEQSELNVDSNDGPTSSVVPNSEPQAKVVGGRTCDLRTCNGGSSYGNFCVPNTSIQKGDVFKVLQHGFSSQVGRIYFVRETMGNCNVSVNGVLTQISPINSMGCPNCCDASGPGGNGWKQYSSQAGGWCWGNNGSGPSSFPCGGGAQTYSCNGSTCNPAGSIGQYSSMAACQADCGNDIFVCTQGSCVQNPTGNYPLVNQYPTMQQCQQNCESNRTWNCTSMGHCLAVNNNSGQYPTEQDCLNNCEQPTYNCKWVSGDPGEKTRPGGSDGKRRDLKEQANVSGYQCVPHQGSGTGQYPDLAACQAVCGDDVERNYCVNCEKQVMSYYPGMPSGSQTSCGPGFVDIGTNPSPMPGPCYECVNNNCIQGNGWIGEFNSMSDCQNGTPSQPACQTTLVDDYECVNGGCVIQSGGQFNAGPTSQDNLNACNAACGPLLWECDTNNGCSQTSNGTHSSQSVCETACCQDVITNWGWAQGPQTNPCQKFYNLFYNNSPATFVDQCKYDYLYNLVLNLPGANPCVQGNFINLLDGFMTGNNQCYGNPASGCDTSPGAPFTGPYSSCPAQNSVCGKRDQFCGITNQSPSQHFKCQYAINFASANTCICQ